jgi:hypothetical protein
LFGEWKRCVELFRTRAGTDCQQRPDSCIASALQHGFAVVRELWGVDVRVRVD